MIQLYTISYSSSSNDYLIYNTYTQWRSRCERSIEKTFECLEYVEVPDIIEEIGTGRVFDMKGFNSLKELKEFYAEMFIRPHQF